ARAAAAVRVWMSPRNLRVPVGKHVSITVRVANGADLGSVPFHVVYDPKVVRFQSGVEGTFLKAGGRETAFFATPATSGNEVVVGLSRLGRGNGAGGKGNLCTLTFEAIGPGEAHLAFSRE